MSDESSAAGPTSRIEKKLDGGKQVVRIYLLDNSTKTLIVDEETTATAVCETMGQKIGFRKPEVASLFALYVYTNGVEDRVLGGTESVLKEVSEWPEGSGKLLVFQVKLFMDSLLETDDPKLTYLLYSQCVQYVITGKYPVDKDVAVKLAAYQVKHRFGAYDASVHKPGFLTARLREFIPQPVMKAHRISSDAWEGDIFKQFAELADDVDPMSAYITEHTRHEYFGCAFYPARQKDFARIPKQILLGINSKGITILRLRSKESFLSFKLSEIYRWGFKPDASFYFEVKSANASGPVHEFETNEGNAISDLLTDYAMALLKELGISGQGGPQLDEDSAAARVQALYRGFRLRRDLEREYAAVRIQAIFRGHTERAKFDQMIEQMEAELDAPPPGM